MSESNLRPNQYRVAGLLATAFLATLWLGCTKSDTTKRPSDSGSVVAAADNSLVPHDDGLDGVPGSNPNKTRAYLQQLNAHWRKNTPDTATLDCDDDLPTGGHPVPVFLYTHQLTHKIKTDSVLDRNANNNTPGHIVMKIVNRGTVACQDLQLQPGDSVYLWAGQTRARRAFAVFHIDQQGNAVGIARALGGLRCRRAEPTEPSAHAVLPGHCEPDATGQDILYTDAHITGKGKLSGPIHDQGLWYGCPGGCCQANNFGPY